MHTLEYYFIKAEHFFGVYIASSKHSGARRILESYANPYYVSGLRNSLKFSQPSSCLDEAM